MNLSTHYRLETSSRETVESAPSGLGNDGRYENRIKELEQTLAYCYTHYLLSCQEVSETESTILTCQSADLAESRATVEIVKRRLGTFLLLGIVLITGWTFLPTLQNGFVDWDEKSLVNNSAFRGLGWPELRWMFAGFQFGRYEPVTWLTFGLDHVVWWADPFGYHWTNLLLHAVNVTAVYLLALGLFSFGTSGDSQSSDEIKRLAAGLSALVFAVHPLRVEPVAWASARGQILASLFFLSSVLFYLQAVRTGQANRRGAPWMTLSVLAYGLSLLSGMSGIALPGVLLVLDLYPLGRFAASGNWLSPEARRLYKEKTPYLLIALVAVAIAFIGAHEKSFGGETFGQSAVTEILRGVAAPVFQFWKAFVPFGLSPVYELRGWVLALTACASLAVSIWLYSIRKRWPALLSSWVCYLMLLWLVPNHGSFGVEILSDRRTYLSAVPWAVLIGAAAMRCWQAYLKSGFRRWLLFAGIGGSAMILLGLGALTSAQTRVWRDTETLWKDAAAGSGASKAHYNLAALFETKGKYDEAIASYRQVVKIDPRRWDAHEKAALLLQKQDKIGEAVEHFRSAVKINPDATDARSNLAAGLVFRGEMIEAVQQFRRVLEVAPERNDTRVKLGTILAVQGRLGEATVLLQQAVENDPEDAKTLLKLGQVLAAQGDLDRAIPFLREAVRMQKEDAEAQESLGRALVENGRKDEGAKHLQEALRIMKSSPVSR
jgi:protein O-mannosyl-transferase